jgi:hypothetical protein
MKQYELMQEKEQVEKISKPDPDNSPQKKEDHQLHPNQQLRPDQEDQVQLNQEPNSQSLPSSVAENPSVQENLESKVEHTMLQSTPIKFQSQLAVLAQMGFLNDQLSSQLLENYDGDVFSVVNEYLSRPDFH